MFLLLLCVFVCLFVGAMCSCLFTRISGTFTSSRGSTSGAPAFRHDRPAGLPSLPSLPSWPSSPSSPSSPRCSLHGWLAGCLPPWLRRGWLPGCLPGCPAEIAAWPPSWPPAAARLAAQPAARLARLAARLAARLPADTFDDIIFMRIGFIKL